MGSRLRHLLHTAIILQKRYWYLALGAWALLLFVLSPIAAANVAVELQEYACPKLGEQSRFLARALYCPDRLLARPGANNSVTEAPIARPEKKGDGKEVIKRSSQTDSNHEDRVVPLTRPAVIVRAGELLKTGDVFKECDFCPEMVAVPAGTFKMGSPNSEPEREPHRKGSETQHEVRIRKPFAVGRFAVTFAEWDACVANGSCAGHVPADLAWGRGKQTVIHVSWDDAKSYVAWLSKTSAAPYRLLTEAEREYVGRAGTTSPFWWGYTISTDQANYNPKRSFSGAPDESYRQRTVPVDSFKPNPWGLYQVHGNVWEWVEDCWTNTYEGAPTDGSAVTGQCKHRSFRGGSWADPPGQLRAAFRDGYGAGERNMYVGFRVARSLP